MRLLGVLILGGVGAIFLAMFVLSWMAGEWLPMGMAGGAVVALAYGIIIWLRPDDPAAPAPTDPGTPWDPLKDGAPRERTRADWSDHGGAGEAAPAGDASGESSSGESGGEGGGSSD